MRIHFQSYGKTLTCLGLLSGVLLLAGCKDADEQANADLQKSRDKQMEGMAAGSGKPAGYDAAKGGTASP